MKLPEMQAGTLVRRYKRFLADITDVNGKQLTIHCPNTGAMTGCAEPGSKIYYSRSDNQKRKYPHTLEFVETEHGLVSVNTGRANNLVKDALLNGRISEVGSLTIDQVKPEAAIPGGAGRFDFQLA
ncbi:MAG: DNA/RNA nuclease SfsA, partial [Pseudomonadota bacterium]|nr:DNA/RNA nuclease SfsA [Pseudomonadota bacterium]